MSLNEEPIRAMEAIDLLRELCCRQNKNKDGRPWQIHRGRACSLEPPASSTTKRHI